MPGANQYAETVGAQEKHIDEEPHKRPEAALDRIRRARRRLSEVRQELARPEGALEPDQIGACAGLLEESIACLGEILPAAASAELLRECKALRFELGIVRRLIEGGAEFYRGWGRVVAAVAAGYTPSGDPAPLTAARTVSFRA